MWPSSISSIRLSSRARIRALFRSTIGTLQGNAQSWRRRSREESPVRAASCPNRVFRGSRARTVCRTKVGNARARIRQQAINQQELSILIQSKLKLRIRDDDAALTRVLFCSGVEPQRRVAQQRGVIIDRKSTRLNS